MRGKTGAQGLNGSYTYAARRAEGRRARQQRAARHRAARPLAHDRRRSRASTTALRPRERALQDLIVNFNTTAGAFAAQSGALTQAVGLLGPTLTTADAAFKSLDALVPADARLRARLHARRAGDAGDGAGVFPWIAQTRALLRRTSWAACSRSCSRRRPTSRGWRAPRSTFLPQLDLANRCFASTIIPAGDIGVEDGALTTRRGDG